MSFETKPHMSQMLAFRVEGYALGVLKWYAPSTETPCSRGASSTPHQQPIEATSARVSRGTGTSKFHQGAPTPPGRSIWPRPKVPQSRTRSTSATAAMGPGQSLSAQPMPTPPPGRVPARRPSKSVPQRGRRANAEGRGQPRYQRSRLGRSGASHPSLPAPPPPPPPAAGSQGV